MSRPSNRFAVFFLVATALTSCDSITGKDENTDQDPASLLVSPAATTVLVGDTFTLTAEVRDSSGRILPGQPVTWTSHDLGIVRVSGNGLVTAVGIGSASITAATRELTDSVRITVKELPQILAAAGRYVLFTADDWPLPKQVGVFPPPNTAGGMCCACPLRITAASIELQPGRTGVAVTPEGREYLAAVAYEKAGCPTSDGAGFSPPLTFLYEGLRGIWRVEGTQILFSIRDPSTAPGFSNAVLRADTLRADVARGFGEGYTVTFAGAFVRAVR